MKESDQKEDEPLIKEIDNPPLLQKTSTEDELDPKTKKENRDREIAKEIRRSYFYNMKDYIFFFSLMISPSMNFSYLYFPLILCGVILYFLIGKNSKVCKSTKFCLELISMIYSVLLIVFKSVSLALIKNDNSFISENKDLFLDLGICYLREDSSFFLIMTFLGESIVLLFSIFSVIISKLCNNFNEQNDTSLMKSKFWTERYLIILNYFFLLSFAVFNTSFSTLFYIFILQILFFLSSLKIEEIIIKKLSKLMFIIFKYCILIHIIAINILNVPRLQENVLHDKDITDKDGNVKIYSIYTQLGINYAYNIKVKYIWKEWIGYLAAICSLISLLFSLNNIALNEPLLKKKSTLSLDEAKNILKINEENDDEINSEKKLVKIKRRMSKGFSTVKKVFLSIINFITSSVFIMQFCRIMSIFYMYIYPNFFSIGIFVPLFFSSLFLDIKMNKNLTIYCLAPFLTLTIFLYHLSNINGFYENYDEEKRMKHLTFALGKYEYSFLEYYGHHLFYFFVMFLIYSFTSTEKEERKKRISKNINNLAINEEGMEQPLLEDNIVNNENDNNSIDDEEINIVNNKWNDLNLLNLFLKFIFTHIDKITLIAMYFTSMRSINLIHLILVIIFLIQILLPHKIPKMYKVIICILQILFFIELLIYLLKAYFINNFNKDTMNFILKYSDIATDKEMELLIYLVLYCFYFQYQFDNFPYLKNLMKNKKINLGKFVDEKFKKLPTTKYVLTSLGIIISNLYIWILIALFFVVSCYFEINLIFAIKLAYFLLLTYLVLRKIQNPENGNKFAPIIHYVFLIFCSLNSFLVYLYQFRDDNFINSLFSGSFSENFFTKNLPNIGFSIYLKDNLYLNFLPHFGITFISVLFIAEIQRQLKGLVKRKFKSKDTMNILQDKKNEIDIKLEDEKKLSEEEVGLLKAKKYEENNKVLKHLALKYFFANLMKIFTAFYWLLLFLIVGIIFSFYDLSFSMVIYIIIFGLDLIFMFYRRITKLNAYIKKTSYFVSKVIRYTTVEQPISVELKKFYRGTTFKYLLSYNFIFFIFLYLYGVFDLFQHGCNDEFFKGCEESNEPIFEEDGTIEQYIKSFSYLFGIYVDIKHEGLIKRAWVHILLSVLIGFDIYAQKLEIKYIESCTHIRSNMLKLHNENNTLFRYDRIKDTNILIKIGMKLAGVEDSRKILKDIRERNPPQGPKGEKKEEKEKTLDKSGANAKEIIEIKTEEKKEENETNKPKEGEDLKISINTEQEDINKEKNDEDEKIMAVDEDENLPENKFLENIKVQLFKSIFDKAYSNKQTLSDSNNNSTKLIWFLKKIFEELIIVLLICIALTKLNVLSFLYFIYFAYLTTTKKTMIKFYNLYCLLLILIIIQSVIYITNISKDTSPKVNEKLLKILEENLSIPWYHNRLDIEKKYAFFFDFGVNKTQMGLLLLEYFQVIVIYIYLDFFSFSIYQDVVNRGEKEPSNSKFNFATIKLNDFIKRELKNLDNNLYNQYRECLLNFNLELGKDINEMLKTLSIDNKDSQGPGFRNNKLTKEYEKLIDWRDIYFKIRERMRKQGRDSVPDSTFIMGFQEFIYLYLHIFILLSIIVISVMITGLISIFYLSICVYYFINSQKIYLGIKYGYPKQIKKLLKICLIADIVIQLIYQVPYIPSETDSLFYKIFNSLGFTKLLNYSENSEVEMASAGIIEIIGKPLIYLFISLQTIIYNSKDFKRYYIMFLLSTRIDTNRNGFVNSFIFNNSRVNEFQNTVDMKLTSQKNMDELEEHLKEWSKDYQGIKKSPLQFIMEKEEQKKIEEEKKDIIENKPEEIKKEDEAPSGGLFAKLGKKMKEEKEKENEPKKEDEAPSGGLFAKLGKKMKEEKEKENEPKKEEEVSSVGLFAKLGKKMKEEKKGDDEPKKEEEAPSVGLFGNLGKKMKNKNEKKDIKDDNIFKNIKEKGIFGLVEVVADKNRETIDPKKIEEKIRQILLSGKLTRFYLWFNKKALYFKTMEFDNKWNFEKECFVGNIVTKSLIENEIDAKLKILDLSDFDKKEVELIEEFFIKYKNGKLFKELEKIKAEIRKAKINRLKEMKNNEEINEINTNVNNNIINNNNNINNFDEEELENIEVEYKIKRGNKDININTMKYKQFYHLLDTKLFKIYLQKKYLIKSILSKMQAFFANNFDYLTYFVMIINHMVYSSILSLFYPISIFCFALLENPRPKKLYWQICLYYSILILLFKFFFQLKIFNSIMDAETYSSFVIKLYNYKIGIKYFTEGFGSKFFNYIAFDALNLLILSLNKNILISNGLWDRREEQIENIFLASERYQIHKDREVQLVFGSYVAYRHNKLLKEPYCMEQEDKSKKRKKKEKKEEINITENKINENKPLKDKDKKNEEIKREDIILFYEGMKDDPRYDEGNKKYFEKLFPRIRNEKPGTDKYPFMALSLAVVIIYILLFFTQMAQDKTYGPVNLDTTQFSGNMVLFLIFHVIVLVYDRIIYISQNKSNLKYKYFFYKKDKINKGIPISKEEYDDIISNENEGKAKYFHFSTYNINKYKDKNYNLFYIQTEAFNCPLLQKYILHIVTTVICHIFAFFYFPMVGNYNLVNNIYCTEEEEKSCNDFNNNVYIILFYIFYLIYLYVSSVQIRLGYYDVKRKSLFKKNTGVTNLMGTIFNAIPFLPQIRNVIDWTFTSTCFDIFQWIKFESIYDSIYDAYKDADEEDDAPLGEKVERKKKISIGGILSFVLIFILIIPLVLFSSLNPTNKLNNLTGGKLNIDLAFIYGNDVELDYNLFETTRAKSISDMFKDGDDSNWIKYKYDKSVETRNFEHKQIQIIKFSETSDRNWDLAEPHILDLIELLNITNNQGLNSIQLKIHTEFQRLLPAEAQTVSHDFELTIYDSSKNSSEEAEKITKLKDALEQCTDVSIELKDGYSSPLRITAGEEITEIEDEKYIAKKDIQIGFQGCEIEEKKIKNETKIVNTYLKSYFTFKSKDPDEKEYTPAEFHAFNDIISETTSGYSVLTFYLTFILVAGSYVADFLASEPEKIMFSDLPHPEKIVALCESIKISRYSYDFKQEEYLYTILIEIMRTPEYLKDLTRSSLEVFHKRKQNNAYKNDDEDDDDKDKKELDNDDEDNKFYKSKKEISDRIKAEIERVKQMKNKNNPNFKKDGLQKNNEKKEEKKENENNIDNKKEEIIKPNEKTEDNIENIKEEEKEKKPDSLEKPQ